MEKVIRKTMLYKTGVEYGDYTINHIIGCSHGCKYPCYAYMMAHRFGKAKTMSDWCEPVLIDNYMEILNKELPKDTNYIIKLKVCNYAFLQILLCIIEKIFLNPLLK